MADLQYVKGFSKLAEAMRDLPEQLARNALKGAVGAAAKVIRDEARNLAPVYEGPAIDGHPPAGTLRKCIVMKYATEASNKDRITFVVAVRAGKNAMKVKVKGANGEKTSMSLDAYYWRFVEFGTVHIAPRAFMRTAFQSNANNAIDRMREVLAAGVQKAQEKYGRL